MKHGYRVIDSELHLMEPPDLWERRLPEPFRSRIAFRHATSLGGNAGVDFGNGVVQEASTSEIRGLMKRHTERRMAEDPRLAHAARNCTPEVWQQGMDEEGIDVAILMPTRMLGLLMVDGLDPEQALAVCRVYNDWAAEFCSFAPERFKFWAWIPKQSAELAAGEARRCIRNLGAIGAAMPTHGVDDHLLLDNFYEPLWAELNELEAPLGLHVSNSAKRDNIRVRYQGHAKTEVLMRAIAGVYYAQTSLGELIYGGVLERYPRLKPVIMETSVGWVPWLLWRLDEMWDTFGPDAGHSLQMRPSDYFRRQCYAVADADESLAGSVVEYGLENNILFSTDFPHHDSPWPEGVNTFLSLASLSDASKRKILWDNGAALYGLRDVAGERVGKTVTG
jgi:predicted TIM-barrel fold metal-dependent hydrolase